MRRLGIMGGTFDPVHYGHLFIAEEARQAFALDQVVFVPNGQPALDKGRRVSPAEDRCAMTELAIASNPHFVLSRVEIDRSGPSYALDTVRHFRRTQPDPETLFFITGADALLDLPRWHESAALLASCRFVAALRPGFDLAAWRAAAEPSVMARVDVLLVPLLEISSTDLRRRVGAGRSVTYLTPEPVEEYIRRQGLYQND